jgi:acyl-CoA synthetase (NDP forming)
MAHPDAVQPDLDAIQAIVAAARRDGRSALLEPEGLAVLAAAGVGVPRWRLVRSAAELDDRTLADLPGDRVVVKLVARDLSHKTEIGGVMVVPRDRAAVASAIEAMAGRWRDASMPSEPRRGAADARMDAPGSEPDGFLVVEHVDHDQALGGELLVSLRWTSDFGPIVSVGGGGIQTEALARDLRPGREIAIVSPTLTPPARIGAILQAATAVRLATTSQRGQPARLALDELVRLVRRLFELGTALVPAELLDLELNPVAVSGGGLVALDVLAQLGTGPATAPAPRPVHKIARLLAPRSMAIVGVSSGTNPGRVILGNLLREGYPRAQITVLKPACDEIDGVRCVPDLEALAAVAGKVDLLVVALSAAQAPDLVAACVEGDHAESLIVIPAGFEEKQGGDERASRMRAAVAEARRSPNGGPLINGGNCLGIRSRPGRYDTLFIPAWKLPTGGAPAPIALVTGSGAFAVTRLSRLGRLDPRYVITVGNQMDLTVGDYLEHFVDDPETRVIGVYVEGFGRLDGARFLAAAAEITAGGRGVVLYRAGRTTAGARASASHTASIAGDSVVTRQLAAQAGVAWAETPAAFDDLVRTFTLLDGRQPTGRRLGALTNAGSECVTIADHLGSLTLPDFAPATEERLAAVLGSAGITSVVDVHNPIDLTPIAGAEVYEAVARIVIDADEVDVVLVGIVPVTDTLDALPPGPGHDEDLARAGAIADRMIATWRTSTKPWVLVADVGPLYDPFVERLEAAGIPTFRTADAATRTLGAWCDVQQGRPRA